MAIDSNDREMLMSAMLKLGNGIYERVDTSSFEDKEIAEVFNTMLSDVARRNNNYLMRLNQSMEMIGNSSWLKDIFEIIDEQQVVLKILQDCEDTFTEVVKNADNSSVDALTIVRKLEKNINPVLVNIDEIKNMISDGEYEEKINSDTAAALIRLLEFNRRSIDSMRDDTTVATDALKRIYDSESSRAELAQPVIDGIHKLEESCNQLTLSCIGAGSNIHKISRCVDNIRNDMFRGNTDPSLRDSLRVYGVDHLVVVWRLYNHIMEYEVLRIEQLNNYERCKFGVWVNMTSPQWIRKTAEFATAKEAHEILHSHVVACFVANENMDKALARSEFEESLKHLEKFIEALNALHTVLINEGMSEESGTLSGNIF